MSSSRSFTIRFVRPDRPDKPEEILIPHSTTLEYDLVQENHAHTNDSVTFDAILGMTAKELMTLFYRDYRTVFERPFLPDDHACRTAEGFFVGVSPTILRDKLSEVDSQGSCGRSKVNRFSLTQLLSANRDVQPLKLPRFSLFLQLLLAERLHSQTQENFKPAMKTAGYTNAEIDAFSRKVRFTASRTLR